MARSKNNITKRHGESQEDMDRQDQLLLVTTITRSLIDLLRECRVELPDSYPRLRKHVSMFLIDMNISNPEKFIDTAMRTALPAGKRMKAGFTKDSAKVIQGGVR